MITQSNRSGIDTEMQKIFSQLSQKQEKQAILSLKTSSGRNIFLTTLLVCFLTSVVIFEDWWTDIFFYQYIFFIWTLFRDISETICGSNWWNYNGRSKYWSKIIILLHKFTSRWCNMALKETEAMWASLSCLQKKIKNQWRTKCPALYKTIHILYMYNTYISLWICPKTVGLTLSLTSCIMNSLVFSFINICMKILMHISYYYNNCNCQYLGVMFDHMIFKPVVMHYES